MDFHQLLACVIDNVLAHTEAFLFLFSRPEEKKNLKSALL